MAIRIGQRGVFVTESNEFYEAVAMVRPTKELPSVQPGVSLKIPRISYVKLQEIIEQMRYVAVHRHSEFMVALYYSHKEQEYMFVVPEQQPYLGYRLRTGPLPPSPPGFNMIGDIHSHMDCPAGHSSWDDEDEEDIGGIHITIGNLVTSVFPTISCSVVVDGHRVSFQTEDLFEPPPVMESPEMAKLTRLKLSPRPRFRWFVEIFHDIYRTFLPNDKRGGKRWDS